MIQLLRGTKSQLETSQTVFADGQPVFEKDTGQLKIGNGSDRYSALEYVGSIFEQESGGSSSEITYSGDVDNGWIDFPGGLRYSWLNLSLAKYSSTRANHEDDIFWNSATMSLSVLYDQSDYNWKSVVLDQTATIYSSNNNRVGMLTWNFDSEGPYNFNVFSLASDNIQSAVVRVLTWSHD